MIRNGMVGFCALAILAACGSPDVVLPGERLDVRAPFEQVIPAQNRAAPIRLAPSVNHTEWTHRAGTASHTIRHPAFGATPQVVWTAAIGAGNDRRHRISGDPVAAEGRIYTIDSRAKVAAVSAAGQVLWQRALTSPADKSDDASGGGLATSGGVVYATTGFGELVALKASDGSIVWRQRLDAPAAGAPTVANGLVYVVSRDSHAWAINALSGRIAWQLSGTPSLTGVTGGAAPAVGSGIVVFPYGSAEIAAAFPRGGLQRWRASVAGSRVGRAYAQLSDVTGDPVIQGGVVYAGNPSGRTVAIDVTTGDTRWRANDGATGPVWVAGGSVFLISDKSELVRLSARDGSRVWAVPLPEFVPTRNARRLRDIYPHYGPVLAGGRLWVASGDGKLRGFDPTDGRLAVTVDLPAGAASRPIVVDGVMYLISAEGALVALR